MRRTVMVVVSLLCACCSGRDCPSAETCPVCDPSAAAKQMTVHLRDTIKDAEGVIDTFEPCALNRETSPVWFDIHYVFRLAAWWRLVEPGWEDAESVDAYLKEVWQRADRKAAQCGPPAIP